MVIQKFFANALLEMVNVFVKLTEYSIFGLNVNNL